MTSTGTYTFDPRIGEIIVHAFAKCGKRRTDLTVEDIKHAEFECNLLAGELTNSNPHQFLLENQTQVLTTSATYSLEARVSAVAVAYLTSDADDNSRVLGVLSASDYASITDKTATMLGGPTTYFFSLLKTPTITVWPLVDSSDTATYTLNLQTFRQPQDFEVASGVTTDLPYRFFDAFTIGLAARLAETYAPDKVSVYSTRYDRALSLLESQDQEDTPISIAPDVGGYYV
jgi:hypothetical protein